jgi:hypothetical protein
MATNTNGIRILKKEGFKVFRKGGKKLENKGKMNRKRGIKERNKQEEEKEGIVYKIKFKECGETKFTLITRRKQHEIDYNPED